MWTEEKPSCHMYGSCTKIHFVANLILTCMNSVVQKLAERCCQLTTGTNSSLCETLTRIRQQHFCAIRESESEGNQNNILVRGILLWTLRCIRHNRMASRYGSDLSEQVYDFIGRKRNATLLCNWLKWLLLRHAIKYNLCNFKALNKVCHWLK